MLTALLSEAAVSWHRQMLRHTHGLDLDIITDDDLFYITLHGTKGQYVLTLCGADLQKGTASFAKI